MKSCHEEKNCNLKAGDPLNSHLIICQLYRRSFEIKKQYFTLGFPLDIYEVIMSIQAAFFLSHQIRKYVDLFLVFLDDDLIIQYVGKKLRYLGPDERSIGMLLMKALSKKDQLEVYQKSQSTPGIWILKKKISDLFLEFKENWQVILVDNDSITELENVSQENLVVIIPTRNFDVTLMKNITTKLPILKFGIKELPQKMRNSLAILKFYSHFEKLKGNES